MLLLVCRGNIEQYFLSPGTMLYCNIVLLEDICLVRLLWQSLISVLTHCCQAQVHVCLKYLGFGTFKKLRFLSVQIILDLGLSRRVFQFMPKQRFEFCVYQRKWKWWSFQSLSHISLWAFNQDSSPHHLWSISSDKWLFGKSQEILPQQIRASSCQSPTLNQYFL